METPHYVPEKRLTRRTIKFFLKLDFEPTDNLVKKLRASVFFNTGLHDHLTRLHVDNLFISGESTSGCVRASVVDASVVDASTFP